MILEANLLLLALLADRIVANLEARPPMGHCSTILILRHSLSESLSMQYMAFAIDNSQFPHRHDDEAKQAHTCICCQSADTTE